MRYKRLIKIITSKQFGEGKYYHNSRDTQNIFSIKFNCLYFDQMIANFHNDFQPQPNCQQDLTIRKTSGQTEKTLLTQ